MFSALCLIVGRVIFGSCSRFFFPQTQLVQLTLKSTILVLVDQKTFSQALLNHVGVHEQTYNRPGRVPYWAGVLVGSSRFQSVTAWCITNVTVVPTTCWPLTGSPMYFWADPPPFSWSFSPHVAKSCMDLQTGLMVILYFFYFWIITSTVFTSSPSLLLQSCPWHPLRALWSCPWWWTV